MNSSGERLTQLYHISNFPKQSTAVLYARGRDKAIGDAAILIFTKLESLGRLQVIAELTTVALEPINKVNFKINAILA